MQGYITVKEAAQKWEVSVRTVQALCAEGKIDGASKMSNVWVIPENAEMPKDGRVKSGEYKNWHKKFRF